MRIGNELGRRIVLRYRFACLLVRHRLDSIHTSFGLLSNSRHDTAWHVTLTLAVI